jgi:hypothetical protein
MRVDHKLWPRHAAAAAVAGARLAGLLQRTYRGPAAGADRPARRLRRAAQCARRGPGGWQLLLLKGGARQKGPRPSDGVTPR